MTHQAELSIEKAEGEVFHEFCCGLLEALHRGNEGDVTIETSGTRTALVFTKKDPAT